ncbi:MAG: DNA/RNA non-specific endonuclease [Bacteroidales bacterium]|nr:DNA/RNA non-specific endonuclease [Bacteroidales bacterium]
MIRRIAFPLYVVISSILAMSFVACSVSRTNRNVSIPDWLELPVMSPESSQAFHTLPMKIDGRTVRNYSFIWDKEHQVAPWVAYPLTSENIGNVIRRTNEWGLNPNMPKEDQPLLVRGYKEGDNGWYSRGHQIASADRLLDRESNATTFYGTNMTPQDGDFNGGIWNSLEMKVRGWANNCDTLYVVTGCLVKDSEHYALDNDGKKVAVPTAYYKALLAYKAPAKGRKPFGLDGFAACGYFFEHKKYPDGKITREMAISIDELEKITGEDFFPRLSSVVGKKNAELIEKENPSSEAFWK